MAPRAKDALLCFATRGFNFATRQTNLDTTVQSCDHLLGKGWSLGSLVCGVFLCLCHFPIQCPGSGVVLGCIDS